MSTLVLSVTSSAPEQDVIDLAANILRRGELVAFPTETVYGLGANALDPRAVSRIFMAKERPEFDPLIVHFADFHQLELIASALPESWSPLLDFWPGPLTLLLPKTAIVPKAVTAGRDTVGVRMPRHPVALALIRTLGFPIAAPSANRFTRPSPTRAAHVLSDLEGRIPLILDGGPSDFGLESTIVDLSGRIPRVVRPGAISVEALQQALPELEWEERKVREGSDVGAPGQLLRHYAPRCPVVLICGELRSAVEDQLRIEIQNYQLRGLNVGVLVPEEFVTSADSLGVIVAQCGSWSEPEKAAALLFQQIRWLESCSPDVIIAIGFADHEVGRALQDRLFRAAEGRVVYADAAEHMVRVIE